MAFPWVNRHQFLQQSPVLKLPPLLQEEAHADTPNHKPGNVPLQIPPSLHKAPRYTQLYVAIPRFHHFSSAQGSSCPLPPWNERCQAPAQLQLH